MSDTTSKGGRRIATPLGEGDELELAYRQEAQYALHLLSLPAEDRPVHIMLRAKELLAARKQYCIQERIDELEHIGYLPGGYDIGAKGRIEVDTRIAELTALKTKQEVAN